jgi:hypothetical protein
MGTKITGSWKILKPKERCNFYSSTNVIGAIK